MPDNVPESKPVEDSVPKVDNAVAVGENLDFQRKWWRFERATWVFFSLLILADIAGLFGRGPLAQAEKRTDNDALTLHYERIERTSTPSVMTFQFGRSALQSGRIQLFVSQSVVKQLGAQRISPQPASSVLGNGGITYTFPATDPKGLVEISLEPSLPGVFHFTTQVGGAEPISGRIVVMP